MVWLHPHEHGPPLIKILNLSGKPIFEYGCDIVAKPKKKVAEKERMGWKSERYGWPQDSRHSGIVYVMSWPLTLYLILRSVPG